jgi:hypothetical protein
MLVTSAFDTDNVQLYDYCHRNDLLRNPEISTIFELEIPAKRTVGEKPLAVADSESKPLPHAGRAEAMHMNMHIRSQNPKEPRIQISRTLKHAKMSPLTQIAMVKSVSAYLKPSTKMLLKVQLRTPMAMILVLRMTLLVKKGRLN